MRILVTPQGEIEFNNLSVEFNKSKKKIFLPFRSNSTLQVDKEETPKIFSKKSFFRRDELSVNPKELAAAKKIKVAQLKTSLTKGMIKKYYNAFPNDQEETAEKIKSFYNSLKPENEVQSPIFHDHLKFHHHKKKKKEIKLKEIMSKEVLNNLEKEFIKKEREKEESEKVITPNNFRSEYKYGKKRLEEMDNILNKTIKTDRTNIIKYFKSRKYISPLSIKNLANYPGDRLMKLNKICQIALFNKEDEIKRENIVDKKLLAKEREIKISTSNSMVLLKQEIKYSKNILKNYEKKKITNPLLRDFVNTMNEKYWSKNRANYFQRPAKKLKTLSTKNSFSNLNY